MSLLHINTSDISQLLHVTNVSNKYGPFLHIITEIMD